MTVLPRTGEAQLPVTCPTMSPFDQIGEPSTGAAPSIVNPSSRRWSGSLAVRSSAARPMNARLVHPGRPVHPEAARRRVELRVHPDDDVALLEAQREQRLEAVRADPEVTAQVQQRPPQLDRAVDRVMQLPGRLARERQAHHVARDAGDVCPDVRQEPGRVGEAGADQQRLRERPGHVDRGEGHRPVHDVDAEVPGVDPVADPHLGVGRAAGREAQHEPGLGLAQDHPVVHDVAALVEQQRVAGATGLDVRDVARIEPLQELDDIRPGHDQLAERADVADRDGLADRPVFGDRVAVVPRPPPRPEPVHPRPERDVLLVERGPPEGIDVDVSGRLGQGDLARGRTSRERLRHVARPFRDPGTDLRQARPALARPEAGEAGPLDEFELLEALVPGALEAVDGDLVAAADDALGGRRRERMLVGGIADDGQRDRAGHPRQDVARREAQAKDRGVAGSRRLGAGRRVGGHDRADVAGVVALEADEATVQALAGHAQPAASRSPPRDPGPRPPRAAARRRGP